MMQNYVFFRTTADDERDYFYGDVPVEPPRFSPRMQPGQYRMMAGKLFRVLPGVPPRLR